MMKKLIIGLFALSVNMLPNVVMASGPAVPLQEANNDITDQASLQRGAKLFMNYCLGCHQLLLTYIRWDPYITESTLITLILHLMTTKAVVHEQLSTALQRCLISNIVVRFL